MSRDAPEPKRESRPGPTSVRAQLCVVAASPLMPQLWSGEGGRAARGAFANFESFLEEWWRGGLYTQRRTEEARLAPRWTRSPSSSPETLRHPRMGNVLLLLNESLQIFTDVITFGLGCGET